MEKIMLEYIWLDGYQTPNLRSKVKIISWDSKAKPLTLTNIPPWNFDGSSTRQATGSDSECMLRPARMYKCNCPDQRKVFVFCEVYDSSGVPHKTNHRAKLRTILRNHQEQKFWWGFEQEYFITKDFKPIGFPDEGQPKPQGLYYCGVGSNQAVGRQITDEHLHFSLLFGLGITGTNAEVAPGQWEYQVFSIDTLKACDDLWVSRFFLLKAAESHGLDIDITPKPISGDWAGNGCHTNFSTEKMRTSGGIEYIQNLMLNLEATHTQHIAGYGEGNDLRLTGKNETQHINAFSWGVGDREASIRVPNATVRNNWSGYIEDRRPAGNCDPYRVAKLIIETTAGRPNDQEKK